MKKTNGGLGFLGVISAGFFLRECWVYFSNGGGVSGSAAVGVDLGMNYDGANNSL